MFSGIKQNDESHNNKNISDAHRLYRNASNNNVLSEVRSILICIMRFLYEKPKVNI